MSTKKPILRRWLSWRAAAALAVAAAALVGSGPDPMPAAAAQGIDVEVAADGAAVYDFPDNQDQPNTGYPVLGYAPKGTKVDARCTLVGQPVQRNSYTSEVGWVQLNSSPEGTQSASTDHRPVIPAALLSGTVSAVPACPENKTLGITDAEWMACVDLSCPEVGIAKQFADEGQTKIAQRANGGADDRTDAAHHCLWQLHMTVFAGADFARKVGDAHETVAGTEASHAMDFHNNEVARNLVSDERITAAGVKDDDNDPEPGSGRHAALEQAVFDVCTAAVSTAVHVVFQEGQTGAAALVSVDHTEHAGDTESMESIEGHLVYLES
jgi:hypothetical protein